MARRDFKPTIENSGFRNSELGLRISSAVVLVLLSLLAAWAGGVPFLIYSVALSAVLFYEWQAVVRVTPFDTTEALLTAGFVTLLLAGLFGYLFYGLIAFLALGLLLELTSNGDEKSDVRWIGLGALYCVIPAVAFPIIRDSSFSLLLFVFIVVWVTDVAAYFAGRQFGGPKLWPAFSPKKTWSGAVGGAAGAMIVGILFQTYVPTFEGAHLWLFAICLSAVSQIGDLLESGVKRIFGVKDSSQLIPGHGGFLDRVDGLVAAAVPVAILVALGR